MKARRQQEKQGDDRRSKETTGEARRRQEKQGDPREKVESAKRAKTRGGESGSRSVDPKKETVHEGCPQGILLHTKTVTQHIFHPCHNSRLVTFMTK